MAQWAVTIPADRWATERLFHHETVTVVGGARAVATDDEVLLVVDDAVVALARAVKSDGDDLVLAYRRRVFDEPVPADGLSCDRAVTQLDPSVFQQFAARLGAGRAETRNWLVSVAMPIEAATPAEAVRQYWSHVQQLGPVELPTYVWPSGDELAMQAFVLGVEANQDPEEEGE